MRSRPRPFAAAVVKAVGDEKEKEEVVEAVVEEEALVVPAATVPMAVLG